MKENNEKGPERPETNKVLVIDIETTSRSPSTGHMIEIGVQLVDLKKERLVHGTDLWLCEPLKIASEVYDCWAWMHSAGLRGDLFKVAYERGNVDFLEYNRKEVSDMLDIVYVTAFNSGFDFKFLEAAGFEIPYEAPCIMKSAREVVQATDKNGRIKNPNVKEAYDYFFPGNDYVEQHRGADDAYHEAQILLELYKMGKFVI